MNGKTALDISIEKGNSTRENQFKRVSPFALH